MNTEMYFSTTKTIDQEQDSNNLNFEKSINFDDDRIINFVYFTIFIILGSKRLIKYIAFKSKKFDFEIIEKSKKFILLMIFSQIIVGWILFTDLFQILIVLFVIFLFWFLLNYFGLIFLLFTTLFYLKNVLISFIKHMIDNQSQELFENVKKIHLCYDFSNLSFLISILFIFFIYHENEISKIYSKIYQYVFTLKVLLDFGLMIHYIYEIHEQNKENYLLSLELNFHLILIILLIHYLIIFLFLLLKINVKFDIKDFDSMFNSTVKILQFKDYNRNSPICEIRIYKVFKILNYVIIFYSLIFMNPILINIFF